jgi:hypothetical protein
LLFLLLLLLLLLFQNLFVFKNVFLVAHYFHYPLFAKTNHQLDPRQRWASVVEVTVRASRQRWVAIVEVRVDRFPLFPPRTHFITQKASIICQYHSNTMAPL